MWAPWAGEGRVWVWGSCVDNSVEGVCVCVCVECVGVEEVCGVCVCVWGGVGWG